MGVDFKKLNRFDQADVARLRLATMALILGGTTCCGCHKAHAVEPIEIKKSGWGSYRAGSPKVVNKILSTVPSAMFCPHTATSAQDPINANSRLEKPYS